MNTSHGFRFRAARNAAGFSLIELMIVVAIIAILSAVAYPSYVKYVQKSRRADALSALAQTQVIFERCYAQSFSYSVACTALPIFPFASNQGFYAIALSNLTATTFTLTATPTGSQTADSRCALFSINETNQRIGLDASGTAQAECWNP